MDTSRLQLGLIVVLAVGLSHTLSSSRAAGYPGGAAISYAANPVWSAGGAISGDGSAVLITAPADQSVVVSDVILSVTSSDSSCVTAVAAGLGDSTSSSLDTAALGRFGIGVNREGHSYTQYHPIQSIHLNSGAKLDPGEVLTLYADVLWQVYCTESEVDLNYMVSGYFAQP